MSFLQRSRSIAFYILFVIITLSLLLPVFITEKASSSPESANANINRNDMPLVSLKGDWQFYWQQALLPEDFEESTEQNGTTVSASADAPRGATIQVPSSWDGQTLGPTVNDGKPLPRYGYATYRKQMTIAPEQVGSNMALLLESVGSAYRVWVNGQLVDGLGEVSTGHEDAETPWIRLNLVYFTPQTEQIDIIVQVSNHSFRESGMFGDTMFGDANDLTLHVFKKYVLQDLIFIGAFLIIGIYHLMIYFISKRTVDLLWLGTVCLFIALRALLLNKFLFYSVFPDISWSFLMHMQFSVKFITFICYISLIRSLYRSDVNSLVHRISISVGLLMLLYVLIVPPSHFTATFPMQTFVMVLILGYYALFVGFLAVRRKREGAWLGMVGVFAVIIAIIQDFFFFTLNLQTVQLVPYALMVCLLLQAVTISYRYAQIQRRNSSLANELQDINRNLEATVAERTEELRQSNVQLLDSDRQRTQLLENIAHDLGSPLAGMQTQVYLLDKGDARPEQLKIIARQMKQGVDYMKRQVQDLFDLTMMKREDELVNAEWMSVRQLCDRMAEFLQEKVEWGQIELQLSEADELHPEDGRIEAPLVLVDSVAILRVVQNYVENAIKFSSKFPCPVEVNYLIRGQTFVYELTDFGKGIIPDELPHVFERFFKGAGNRKGIGLGLAIAKEMIERHGGEVGVRSVAGEGSTFWFTLPLATAEVQIEPQE